jgi:hypothetical protein
MLLCKGEANMTKFLDEYHQNNGTNTSAFDVFELFDSPGLDNPEATTPTEDPSFVTSPGYDLLVVGLILLGAGVWINIAVHICVTCRRRKRQQAISPISIDVVIGGTGEANGEVPLTISHQRQQNDERDEESQPTAVVTGR